MAVATGLFCNACVFRAARTVFEGNCGACLPGGSFKTAVNSAFFCCDFSMGACGSRDVICRLLFGASLVLLFFRDAMSKARLKAL